MWRGRKRIGRVESNARNFERTRLPMTLFVPFRARLLAIFHDRTKLEQTRLKKKGKKSNNNLVGHLLNRAVINRSVALHKLVEIIYRLYREQQLTNGWKIDNRVSKVSDGSTTILLVNLGLRYEAAKPCSSNRTRFDRSSNRTEPCVSTINSPFPPLDWKILFHPRRWNFALIRVMD